MKEYYHSKELGGGHPIDTHVLDVVEAKQKIKFKKPHEIEH
jgi:hypothetical protein